MNISFNTYLNTTKLSTNSVNQRSKVQQNAKSATRTQDQATISSKTETELEYTLEYTKNANVSNCAAGNVNDSETTFPFFNPAHKYIKYTKVVDEYYAEQNDENKKFDNPEKHIKDKYFNKNSPYYIEGLTQMEREIGAEQEQKVLLGLKPSVNNYDPVIQRVFGGMNSFVADIEYNQEIRGQMNDSINQLFKENGITIPDDADLQLTVDPYDFKIHASGVEKELAQAIENALNKGKNGYYLYSHIAYSNPGNLGLPEPSQFSEGDTAKAAVYHLVKDLTGYDIGELDNKDGKFYAPNGRDLWEVLSDKYEEMEANGNVGSFSLDPYYWQYQRIAREGWNSSTDANLTIGYKNGSLYDIDTSYGYGSRQTAWQDELITQFKKNQKLEREKSLLMDEKSPDKIKMLFEKSGHVETAEENQIGLYGLNGTFYPIQPISNEVIENINRSFKAGLGALTDAVLHTPNIEPKIRHSVDYKA